MRARTNQVYDLRDFKGPIELERGTYNNQPIIFCAQRTLYDLVDEDQVVWCVQDLSFECGKRYHEIEVDCRDIVAVIDCLAWHQIIYDDPSWIPPDVECELWREAVESGEDDRKSAFRILKDKYLKENLPDGPWSAVRKERGQFKISDQLLVKFPFKFSTIVSVKQF